MARRLSWQENVTLLHRQGQTRKQLYKLVRRYRLLQRVRLILNEALLAIRKDKIEKRRLRKAARERLRRARAHQRHLDSIVAEHQRRFDSALTVLAADQMSSSMSLLELRWNLEYHFNGLCHFFHSD